MGSDMGVERKVAMMMILILLYAGFIRHKCLPPKQVESKASMRAGETAIADASRQNCAADTSEKNEPIVLAGFEEPAVPAQLDAQPAKAPEKSDALPESIDRDHRYVTQKEDTLWKIARRFYRAQNDREVKAIVDLVARENDIHNPDRLQPGVALSLPALPVSDFSVLPASLSQWTASASRTESDRQLEHCVEKGQTLRSIARQYYDDEGMWHRIYDANPGKISNPNKLPCGVNIKIPPPLSRGSN